MSEYREDIIDKIDLRLREHPEVRKSVIFGHPGYSIIGRVFCFAYEDGLTVKLHRDDQAEALKLEEAARFCPGGRPMGTWVVFTFPDGEDYLENWHWIKKAMSYIVTDEAAPPKKKRKSKTRTRNK